MNYKPVDLLEVRIWGETVGALVINPRTNYVIFEYVPNWIAGGIELSPLVMPTSNSKYEFGNLNPNTFSGLPGMIADVLPDAFGNAVIESWLAKNNLSKSNFNVLDRLAYIGERGMGALTFHPAQNTEVLPSAITLADVVLQARTLLSGTTDWNSATEGLNQLIQVGSSAGGARAKAIVYYNPQTSQIKSPFLPIEKNFEPWLIKLDGLGGAADGSQNSQDSPVYFSRIEYAYYLMATSAGIEMAPSKLLPEGPRSHFLTKRFDRTSSGGRLHYQSLCALSHLDFKIKGAHDYDQYLLAIKELRLGEAALTQAFLRMSFNVLAMNRDDHTKNFGFLMDEDGQWSLAPAFDITHSYNPEGEWTQRHQLLINGKSEAITRSDLTAVAKRHGILASEFLLAQVEESVSKWRQFAEAAGLPENVVAKIQGDLDLAKRFF